MNESPAPIKTAESASRYVPMAIGLLVLLVTCSIPLKIISYGYLPPDDALRHAAKAVSGKSWGDILVLRDVATMDSHTGWHTLLGFLHHTLNTSPDGLVVVSMVFLFMLVNLIPLFFLKRPESWLLAMGFIVLTTFRSYSRFLLGRPYLFTMMCLIVICFTWPRLKKETWPIAYMAGLALLVGISTWFHGSWYLYAIPLVCFFIANEWKAGFRLGICLAAGIVLGALLTGHPIQLFSRTLYEMTHGPSREILQRMLVTEFRPQGGEPFFVLGIVLLIFWRVIRGTWNRAFLYNPVFVLAVLGFILRYYVQRFWLDWGAVGAMVWVAKEFDEVLRENTGSENWKRLGLALPASLFLYLSVTADIDGRWTNQLTDEHLVLEQAKPDTREWYPEPGGIIYSDNMGIFYQTFFRNPKQPWKYVLGFEPALMPADDLVVYRRIQWNHSAWQAFLPWVAKMKKADRLIVVAPHSAPGNLRQLEWHRAAPTIWIGRIPKKAKDS